jgi:hypothetical protein
MNKATTIQEISWQDFWRSHAPRGASTTRADYKKSLGRIFGAATPLGALVLRSAYSGFCWIPPVVRFLFEVNSEPHTGARPSARLCVGLNIYSGVDAPL